MNQDKVFRFCEFINENITDTPEKYVENLLRKLKTKFEQMFAFDVVDQGSIKKFGQSKKDEENKTKVSFVDFNLELQDINLSKYSKIYDNLKIQFSDEEFLYDLTVTIDLKDAVPQNDNGKDFSIDDIENCQIKFKKYDKNSFELLGELIQTVKVKEIDEDLLVDLKLKIDKEFGAEEEEFSIETEEEGQK
jgi:hypothetical protein